MKIVCAIIMTVLAVSCREQPALTATIYQPPQIPAITVDRSDTALHLENGVWLLHGQPFSGTMETWYTSGQIRLSQKFFRGKEEGLMQSYYENGNREAQRFYRNGEKDSVHRGWWLNGQLQYEYHYRNGEYEGDFKEWYPSGKAFKHIVYHMGKEQWGKGWRENGKPYMSFVMRDGRLYGLINPNLCYSLKNERGEYVENSTE